MYNYSPIKTMRIKNFRNLGDVAIDFDESPIVTLMGDNEAGKTSVVKAFATCGLHAYSRDQKGFIRDGTGGFGIAIEMQDGTMVTRLKTPQVNKYTVTRANGNNYETTKIDSGLPLEVEKEMGLIQEQETKEFLQVRTYEDQLLFVTTPNSTNYKVMYDALKVEQITRAVKIGNVEANELKAAVSRNDVSIQTLNDNLRSIRTVDLEPLINIKNRLASQQSVFTKLQAIKNRKDSVDECQHKLGALSLLIKHNVQPVNLVLADRLNSVNRLVELNTSKTKTLSQLEQVSTLESLDISMLNRVKNILDRRDELARKSNEAGAYKDLGSLGLIDEYTVRAFQNAIASRDKVYRLSEISEILSCDAKAITQDDFNSINKCSTIINIVNRNKQLETAKVESETYINQVNNYLKQLGVSTIDCPRCGETIINQADVQNQHLH